MTLRENILHCIPPNKLEPGKRKRLLPLNKLQSKLLGWSLITPKILRSVHSGVDIVSREPQ